jgi:hypothetical protein
MDDTSSRSDLVPGRECGTCTICCKTLKIDVPELKKLAGVSCQHCTEGHGCRIYETRPPVCKQWYCGWRLIPELTDHWRPDRCGVLICLVGEGEGIPKEFPQLGLRFDIVDIADAPRVLAWDPLIKFIGWEIGRGCPVFLGIPAPIGYERRKVFLNYAMAQAVQSRQRHLMIECLESALRLGLQDGLREKTVFA